MPPSWRQQYSQKTVTDMERFKRGVALTQRATTGTPDQSWLHKFCQLEPISETVDCRISGDELLEEDCQEGGRWEQHIEEDFRRKTAGVTPAEVTRPGHALQIEIAKYLRGQLREDFPPVFDDDDDSSDDEDEPDSSSVLNGTSDLENTGSSPRRYPEGNDSGGFPAEICWEDSHKLIPLQAPIVPLRLDPMRTS